MERQSYLSKYLFDWEQFDVVIGGRSALDSKYFIGQTFDAEYAEHFLKGYGFDPNDPINKAELFGNFQEALQFIKRYFLKEGSPDGLDLKVPQSIYMITEVTDLFIMATKQKTDQEVEERLWAEVILKIMHTILHVDKDIRTNYFSVIQTQVFDRFYKVLVRDNDNKLYLSAPMKSDKIPLVEFETKSKKTRDSVILKLLHKVENVAEELFDRIGVRFITFGKLDTLRVIKFLLDTGVLIPHNIKPSRSLNSLIDLEEFKERHKKIIKMAMKNNLSEERFLQALERASNECVKNTVKMSGSNPHSSRGYHSIQFTGRQLIKYRNPFLEQFNNLRNIAREKAEDNDLAKNILSLDMSLIARDIRFFYPFEIQIVDQESYKNNTEGEASHQEYKRSQQISAMNRVFKPLLKFKNLSPIKGGDA